MRWSRILPILLLLLLTVPACNNGTDTIINHQDCGVIRSDLLGTYTVTFNPVTADLFHCSTASFDGTAVTVTALAIDFTPVQVYASALNAGFSFTNGSSPQGLFGNVEADTCLTGFSVLDNEGVYLQCFGTLNRDSGIVQAACDSATVLQTPVADPPVVLSDCDIEPILQAKLAIH